MELFDAIKREFVYFNGVRKTLKRIGSIQPDDPVRVADVFEERVDQYKSNVALRYEDRLFTYGELDQRANQYAHWALKQGFKPGDTIALLMENRPDYLAFWLGMAKVGVVSALINTNLTGSGLKHCVEIADARALFVDAALDAAFQSTRAEFADSLSVWSLGGEVKGAEAIEPHFPALPTSRPSPTHRESIRARDICLYIYTSGTTGLPKAAKLTQSRVLGMMRGFIDACKITERDRIYLPLPLYHATGGICGVGQAFLTGATLILKHKFSASEFWSDAVEHKATSFVYIGELCRYLVSAPPHPDERAHSIRTGFGNGMSAEVWKQFEDRFGIKHLIEFYGSTEGNVSFVNFNGKIGAVGRLPPYIKDKIRSRIVRFDVETEQPIRGEDGFCQETDAGEVGEAIGEITDAPRQRFEGYKDPSQTEKKILRDVFKPGDMWFRTGDLMKRDEHYFIYFVDRIGDTYRWKSENVSTTQVSEAIADFPGISLPNVYGIDIPHTEGRAGMAAIMLEDGAQFDGKAFAEHVDRALPHYARPVFVRIQKEATTTGTLKFRKIDLVDQGFDVSKIEDPVFVRLPQANEYVELTPEIQTKIEAGEIHF
ncbi:MAG: long-chain-acyl-CoA synthetase [Ponticaulis sp.]|nr:long-chain-acyl-CoA synthetase [Ponticaulis sp.]